MRLALLFLAASLCAQEKVRAGKSARRKKSNSPPSAIIASIVYNAAMPPAMLPRKAE